MTTHRFFTLEQRPDGELKDSDVRLHEQPVAAPAEGQIQLRTTCISIDPTNRIWMSDAPQYMPPIGIDEVVRAIGIGVVEQSNHPDFAVGDRVTGLVGWNTHLTGDPNAIGLQKLPAELPLPDAKVLSLLGVVSGMTAYVGLLDMGQPKEGETLVVDAAAGAVGSLVGQIGKVKGCRVVGIAGGPDKCRHVTETLGFDACIDYKNEDVGEALTKHCPDGIDVCFENVGGEIFDHILMRMNNGGRVALCGMIAGYNTINEQQPGPYAFGMILMRRLTVRGFIILDHADRFAQASEDLLKWATEGKMQTREDVREGFENLPETLRQLLRGQKQGKLVLTP